MIKHADIADKDLHGKIRRAAIQFGGNKRLKIYGLLDCKTGACSNYPKRKELVPDCIKLTPAVVAKMDWLPSTCAYRRVHLGKDLPWWHYLKSGDRDLVHKLGLSVRGKAISELKAGPLEHHIVDWVDDPGPPKPKKKA